MNSFVSSAGGGFEVYVDLGDDSNVEGMMQEFGSPPLVRFACCCELGLADTIDRHHHRSGSHVHDCHLQQKRFYNCSNDERRNSLVYSRPMDSKTVVLHDTTTTTTGCCSGMHDHDQELGEWGSRMGFRSLSCCNSSSEADVECCCWEFRGNGLTNNLNRTKDFNSSDVSPEIECFDVADISAACQLLEMSTSHSGTSGEYSEQQIDSDSRERNIRVSDTSDHETRAFQPVNGLSNLVSRVAHSTHPEAHYDEVSPGQETRAAWVSHDSTSSTTRRAPNARIEAKRIGKKSMKPKKSNRCRQKSIGDRELLDPDEENYDILDRPLRKRQYKSLREILNIK